MAGWTVVVHLEATDDDGAGWWGESEQQPSFSVFADSLAELKELCREAGELYGWGDPVFVLDDDARDPVGWVPRG